MLCYVFFLNILVIRYLGSGQSFHGSGHSLVGRVNPSVGRV